MRRAFIALFVVLGFWIASAEKLMGQEPSEFLAVGEMAPDVQFTGATRHGTLAAPISLSDLRGETIVLAFFFKARTGG
jgi:peroxiredoxin Q/BCP